MKYKRIPYEIIKKREFRVWQFFTDWYMMEYVVGNYAESKQILDDAANWDVRDPHHRTTKTEQIGYMQFLQINTKMHIVPRFNKNNKKMHKKLIKSWVARENGRRNKQQGYKRRIAKNQYEK